MATYQDFKDSLLPGNYALTKSMELTKIRTSGTLWYIKKFLVLYYYIFLSSESNIMTNEYIQKVIMHFDRYIDSLDEKIREDARKYFYPEISCQNFKSPEFKSFLSFSNQTNFENETERLSYYNDAKKCYFALLMGSGGQTAVKEKIIEGIRKSNFTYSHDNIKGIIDSTIASVCAKMRLENKNYRDFQKGDIPRLLSNRAISEICNIDNKSDDLEQKIREIITTYPCSDEFQGKYKNSYFSKPRYGDVENDAFASIRNERQTLYYYGYFHSKSTGAKDMEFSSLTPIGEVALNANSNEFLAIWEHQKVKMVSQPVTADINNISISNNAPNKFAISYTPYLDILGYITRNKSMSVSEYQYIVSRRKHTIDEESWIQIESQVRENIDDIRSFVSNFGRNMDESSEDRGKELKKYLLGIRGDLPHDVNTHSLNILKLRNSVVLCENTDILSKVYNIYLGLTKYKIQKYNSLFERCEQDLKNRYIESCYGNNLDINPKTKIDWDLYNICVDKFIILGTIFVTASAKIDIDDLFHLNSIQLNEVTNFCYKNFQSLLAYIGLNTKSEIKHDFAKFISAINDNNYTYFMPEDEDRDEIVAKYRTIGVSDLRKKLKELSSKANVDKTSERKRNTTLINYLKSYYLERFMENDTLICECCKKEAFITESKQPYVEFHHLIPFKKAYGPDHYLNLFAICPNCHRKMHFLNLGEKPNHYQNLNNNNYLKLSFEERLLMLKHENLIRSYHLEYLLVDKAITEDEYNRIIAA